MTESLVQYENGYIDGVRETIEQAGRKDGKAREWLYSGIMNPTFKICPYCGMPFETSNPYTQKFVYCPVCGRKPTEGRREE